MPGYIEIDLTSHSDASAAGEFLHMLDGVDIRTTQIQRQADWTRAGSRSCRP